MDSHALLDLLKERLAGAERLVVLGVGSVFKADDAAGMRVVEALAAAFADAPRLGLLLCGGETAPENFSGKIKRFCPTHTLVVDAADVGREPGAIVEIRPETVGGPTYCSHMLPLRVMLDYLVSETGTKVVLLGVQHESLAFDGPMTPAVETAVEAVVDAVRGVIEGMGAG